MKQLICILLLASTAFAQGHWLLVRGDGNGHKVRNGVVIGALTAGVGAVPAAVFTGGAKYQYVDSNLPEIRTKYSGKQLQRIRHLGVRVIVVSKKASADEIADARKSAIEDAKEE